MTANEKEFIFRLCNNKTYGAFYEATRYMKCETLIQSNTEKM